MSYQTPRSSNAKTKMSSRTTPKRKAAPEVIQDVEGIESEESGEGSPPSNEEELLAGEEDSDELVEENNSVESVGEDENSESETPVPAPKAKGKAKSKSAKGKKTAAKAKPAVEEPDNASDVSEEPEEVPTPKARGKAKAAPKSKSRGRKTTESVAEDPPAPKTRKGKATKKSTSEEEGDGGSTKRHFKINTDSIEPEIDPSTLSAGGGRFSGATPMQAAKKAFTQICRASGEGEHEFIFSITESTRGKGSKQFTYRGIRTKLDVPNTVKKDGNSFNINYDSNVKAYKPGKETSTTKKAKSRSTGSKTAKADRTVSSPSKTTNVRQGGRAKAAKAVQIEEESEHLEEESISASVDEEASQDVVTKPKARGKAKASPKASPKSRKSDKTSAPAPKTRAKISPKGKTRR